MSAAEANASKAKRKQRGWSMREFGPEQPEKANRLGNLNLSERNYS
jgi:hypothetical protein